MHKAISILNSLDCKYAIIDSNGVKRGDLIIAQSKPKRKINLYPMGEFSNYVKPFLGVLKTGQVAQIPFDKYVPEKVQSAACNWMRVNIGKDSYATHINKESKCIEVLRIT